MCSAPSLCVETGRTTARLSGTACTIRWAIPAGSAGRCYVSEGAFRAEGNLDDLLAFLRETILFGGREMHDTEPHLRLCPVPPVCTLDGKGSQLFPARVTTLSSRAVTHAAFFPHREKEYVLALNAMARNECNERAVSPWLSAENDIPCGARSYGFRHQPVGALQVAFLTCDAVCS